MRIPRLVKDTLVQWTGGGYDGCYWEPNVGFFDANGVYHPIISTGRQGRDTVEEFFKKRDREEDHTFPITKVGLEDFNGHIRDDYFMGTLKTLEDYEYDVWWKCDVCKEQCLSTYEFAGYESYKGDGGIGVISEGMICTDCRSEGECRLCNEYMGKEELVEGGACSWCRDKVLEKHPEHEEKIEELEEEEARLKALVTRYFSVMPNLTVRTCNKLKHWLAREVVRIKHAKEEIQEEIRMLVEDADYYSLRSLT